MFARTYTNTTNPLRMGNALKLYVKQNASIGVGAKVRATVSSINGSVLATPLDLETNGNNTFQDKTAYAEVLTPAGATGMRVEGEITMTWVGAANAIPTGSRLGVTLNAGNAPCVASGSGSGSGGTTSNGSGGTTAPAAGPTSASWLYYAHADHLGTARTITKSTDNIKVWEWRNDDAFGNNLPDENPNGVNGSGPTAQPFVYNLRFPGQYYDQETNTHYNYFRDYDPSTGRYVQSDPIGLAGGMNTYAYVEGNPLSYTDPTGEIIFAPKGLLIGAGLNIFTQLVMNGGNFRCIKWDVVGIAAVTGALNPFSGLAAANSALKAERQWARSQGLRQGSSAARRAAQRGDKHNANSWTEAASWAGVAGGSTIVGKLIPDERHIRIGSDSECRQ